MVLPGRADHERAHSMQSLWAFGPSESSPPRAALLWRQALSACEKDLVAAAEDGNRRRLPGQPARQPETVEDQKPGLLGPLSESASRIPGAQLSAPEVAEPEASAPSRDCKDGRVPASFPQESKDLLPHPPSCKDERVRPKSSLDSGRLSDDCKEGLDSLPPPWCFKLGPRETLQAGETIPPGGRP
jgi:hypothetical protein